MNGDVSLYTPTDNDEHHQGIQQLHYFKPINDDAGILVYVHDDSGSRLVYIALVRVCHTTQKYTVVSRDRFRCFPVSSIAQVNWLYIPFILNQFQGTLIQNLDDRNKMVCVFTESTSEDSFRDKSCVTFFEVCSFK
jgi:hypothetical protein